MDTGLIWLLLFPLFWPFIAWRWLRDTICPREMAINIVIVALLVGGVWYAGKYIDMADTEILNGQIISKHRDHGTYTVSYPCNCRTINKVTSCSTCHTKHYTVDWTAKSTVGKIRLDHADWTSPAVYALPDPSQYKECEAGQPASVESEYTNYVKSAPDSLFHLNPSLNKFDKDVPDYPRVVNYYRINRVISVGAKVDVKPLNDLINESIKVVGAQKMLNIIVILTEHDDQNFKFAVENKWLAGKKNDIIVYIGLDGEKITWADATVWIRNSGNELLAVQLRDSVESIGTYDVEKISLAIMESAKDYTRPKMESYEYLLDEIEPPLWAVIIAALIAVLGSLGLTYYFHNNRTFDK